MAEYVSKNEVRPYRTQFHNVFNEVHKECKKQGLTFSSPLLVGSAKRNLVVRHHNKGFDCDYQIFLQKNKNNMSAKEIKLLLIKLFDKYMPDDYENCEDSTLAITIKKKSSTKKSSIEFSYDVAIMRERKKYDTPEIIRRSENNYCWNFLSDMEDFGYHYGLISGQEMWNDLRERYYDKIINERQKNESVRRKSFQLLHEATNETRDCFEIEP